MFFTSLMSLDIYFNVFLIKFSLLIKVVFVQIKLVYKKFKIKLRQFHPFQILDPSPWPFLVAISIFSLVLGLVSFFHKYDCNLLLFGLFQLFLMLHFWFTDIIFESVLHTYEIRRGLRLGMVLFIISELMFFFSFFWAFFHSSLSPAIELGCSWPPVGLSNLVISPWSVPLLNTVILISSGVTVTFAHHFADLAYNELMLKLFNFYIYLRVFFFYHLAVNFKLIKLVFFIIFINFKIMVFNVLFYLFLTLALAFLFTFLQIFEYFESKIFISDGVYGSTFFLMTGFHGFHVLIGTFILLVCFFRFLVGHFDDGNFVGFESAIWYWHFVDVVWLFLYLFIYVWGGVSRTGLFLFNEFSSCDFPANYQLLFQDPASDVMEEIVGLHHYVMFYLILIFCFVFYLFLSISFFSIFYDYNKSVFSFFFLSFMVFFKFLLSRFQFIKYSFDYSNILYFYVSYDVFFDVYGLFFVPYFLLSLDSKEGRVFRKNIFYLVVVYNTYNDDLA